MCHGKKAEKLAKFRVLDKAPEGSTLTEFLYNIVQDKLRVPKIGDHSPIPSLSLDLCSTSTHVVLPTSCTCQCYHCTINVGAY